MIGSRAPREEIGLGIAPVPPSLRKLGVFDVGVLWGDLAVGVLVLAAGALMVAPAAASGLGMDLRSALIAMVIGSAAGSLLLALVGLAGHDRGVPTMVLLRPVLGRWGSYGASVVNVVQLIGWTSFEFWAMAHFASRVSNEVFGFAGFDLWLIVAACGCTALAVLGPIRFVKVWLEKAGVWIVVTSCGFLTCYLLTRHGLGHLLSGPRRGAPLAVGVDLVVAQPVSWLPVVADYNRFSAGRRENFVGTFGGYFIGNLWFYALGALLVVTVGLSDASPAGIAASILGLSAATVTGVVVLVSLLGGETHEGFADIYSAAVSAQNVFPRLRQGVAVVAIGALGAVIAAVVTLGSYEAFLFLLGSVFVPLFAVLLADWLGGRFRGPTATEDPGLRPGMVAAWVAGFAMYHWIAAPGTMPAWWSRWVADVLPGAGRHVGWGASLPCFTVTFTMALIITSLSTGRAGPLRQEAVVEPAGGIGPR